MSYLSRISATADEQKKAGAKATAAGAKSTVEQRISVLNAKAVELDSAYDKELGATPFNLSKIEGINAEKSAVAASLALVKSILASEFAD